MKKNILKLLAFKLYKKGKRLLYKYKYLRNDLREINKSIININSFIAVEAVSSKEIDKEVREYLIKKYLNHEFDILGSCWEKVTYNIIARGIEGNNYSENNESINLDDEGEWLSRVVPSIFYSKSKKIYDKIDKNYEFIDWHIDFKSGFRFPMGYSMDSPIGELPGVDIKVPWELARMQHLLQMALFACDYSEYKEVIISEFKNQVLDFIMCNPVGVGVNWCCAMEVSIRAANLLVAYDILTQLDSEGTLDKEFRNIFINSMYIHGDFISKNLEYSSAFNPNNHYLSDICGLIFIGMYLKDEPKVNSWLIFGIQELIECLDNQFLNDGSNFEGSTSYHRLSGELVLYTISFVIGNLRKRVRVLEELKSSYMYRKKSIKKQKFSLYNKYIFPDYVFNKLRKIITFELDITKPNEEIVQIGDNDSGRLFKLTPIGEFMELERLRKLYINCNEYKPNIIGENKVWIENDISHTSLINSGNTFFNGNCRDKRFSLEESIIKILLGKQFSEFNTYASEKLNKNIKKKSCMNLEKLEFSKKKEFIFDRRINLMEVEIKNYPDFGLVILKSNDFFFSLRYGDLKEDMTGHVHLDRLSIDLMVGKNSILWDAGTYLYTPLREKRNLYRGSISHNIPIVDDIDQANMVREFKLIGDLKCSLVELSNNHIVAKCTYSDITLIREVLVYEDRIVIKDACNRPFKMNWNKNLSNGYGKCLRSK